jgi:hypothetical protein
MTGRMSSRSVVLSGTFLALAMGGTAACDDAGDGEYRDEERHYQCAVDVNGEPQAVDCDDVDEDGSGGGFIYVGGVHQPVYIHSAPASAVRSVQPGQKLPAGGHRISYSDVNGRTQAGLPPRGPVANNTVKTSVVGKGGAPAPAGAKAGG